MRFFDTIYLILFILVTAVSIYEYKRLQYYKKMLNRCEKTRKELHETSVKISKTNDEDEIYSIALEAIVKLIPNATKGSVLLINEDGNFHFQVVKGFQKELEEFIIKKEEAYLYKINEFKEAAIINNPQEFDRINTDKETIEGLNKINALDICCSISAPIYIDNELIGLINVDSERIDHIFTEKDLELMDQIKCELELAIKNALAQNKLKYLASFDELTGVMNRRTLKIEFDNETEKNKKDRQKSCLVMIDLDNFKFLNDTYGHYFGDMALKHFAEILSNSVRASDSIARFAGDEFILLLKDCDLAMAEKRMKSITEIVSLAKLEEVTMYFSYGICEIVPYDDLDLDKSLAFADTKMYEQKKLKEVL
jgi:diguanylate cyclase (GGDEF)-like protein